MNKYHERVLVVEDDLQISNFICFALAADGFTYCAAATAAQAHCLLLSEQIDLLLLDLGLPDMDGMDLLKKIRQWSQLPIIIVSAREQSSEKAEALDAGADDYLTKPFSATELMARIRVAIRHLYREGPAKPQTAIAVGALQMDFDKHLAYLNGKELHLTPMEYELLALLFRNIGKVLTTRNIIREIWGPGYGSDTQALRALMAALRRKVENNPANPRYILTETGVGYRLTDE